MIELNLNSTPLQSRGSSGVLRLLQPQGLEAHGGVSETHVLPGAQQPITLSIAVHDCRKIRRLDLLCDCDEVLCPLYDRCIAITCWRQCHALGTSRFSAAG